MSEGIVLAPADQGGCGLYRIMRPGLSYCKFSEKTPHFNGTTAPSYSYLVKNDIKTLITQRQTSPAHIDYYQRLVKTCPHIRLIIDFDDLLWRPHASSSFKPDKQYIEGLDTISVLAHHHTVSTIPLKHEIEKRYKVQARLLPNMTLDDQFFPISPREKNEKLHVLYMGSKTHQDDLEQIIPVVWNTVNKYKWTFIGYLPPSLKGKVNYIDWLPLNKMLAYIYMLRVHVGIAPLVPSLFNECKSNVKLLEYGQLGFATIASSVYPYQGSNALMVKDTKAKHWIKHLKSLEDESFRLQKAKDSVAYARSFSVNNRKRDIERAYT